MEHFKKYLKYSSKIENFKGGNNSEENDFYSSQIDLSNDFYFKQNLYNYWISSSHNTYLPYGQILDPSSVCYYRLQSMIYFGGCLEIDTDSATNDDIIVTHLPTNTKSIKLSSILKVIANSIEEKNKKKYKTGPIILTFDNKKLSKKSEHTVFWNVLNKELIDKDLLFKIDDDYDLRNIPISDISNKVLIRWGKNKKCDEDTDENEKVGKDLCKPKTEILQKYSETSWIHLQKGHIKYGEEIISDNNLTVSISVPLVDKLTNPNINIIVNTQRNIMRTYPHFSKIKSGNYNNIMFYRNGIQIVATNIQTIENSWYLNRAVFMPPTGLPCTPKETLSNKDCNHGWKNPIESDDVPIPYRLKPLWLLGLKPYPGLYDLKITFKKSEKISENITNISNEYHNLNVTYGLTNKEYSIDKIGGSVTIADVDVTVPFFILKLHKFSSSYKTGADIVWDINKLKDTTSFDVYKIAKTFSGYNKVDLDDGDYDCINSTIFNARKRARITMDFEWTKSVSNKNKEHIEHFAKYNEIVKQVRSNKDFSSKKTIDFLQNIELFNTYQNSFFEKMKKADIKSVDTFENRSELPETKDYFESMKQLGKTVERTDTTKTTTEDV
jgi:Phosphatidylinositol-specific phospholipase C, X domain/Phosphatidylinositol-specific phospholipase C, Y domain